MKQRADILAPAKQLKRRRLRRRVFLWLCLFLLAAGGLVWLLNQERWLIQAIDVFGHRAVAAEDVRTMATSFLSGRVWGLFPRRHVLWYPDDGLAAALLRDFPRLATVDLSVDYPRLVIEVIERRPAAVWCPLERPEEFCYFLDGAGVAFSLAPKFSRPVWFSFISPAGAAAALGHSPLPADEVKSLLFFQNQLPKLFEASVLSGFWPVSAAPETAGDYLIRIERRAAPGPEDLLLRVNVNRDLISALGDLAAALASPDFAAEVKQALTPPRLLDLRFPGKVFYRFTPLEDEVI